MNQVNLKFGNQFSGELVGKRGSIKVGEGEGGIAPYELLAGALGSCLYSTFLDIIKKMQLEFDGCVLDIEWEKREEVPTTCKLVAIKGEMSGVAEGKQERFKKAFKLATEYCSVYSTLSQVAEMKWELDFK
jgi:putative redox protein